MSAHRRTKIEALPPTPDPDPTEDPLWRRTLRFEDAPDILDVEDAAILARIGQTGAPVYQILALQLAQLQQGAAPPNPLPCIRRPHKILIRKKALEEWLAREEGV